VIVIKEEFLTHEKTVRAIAKGGAEAIQLWLAFKRYCAINLTDGAIPREDIESLPGCPKRNLKNALKALIECGRLEKDGKRGPGLVVQDGEFIVLHDYQDHNKSREEVELARERDKIKKRLKRQKAEEELAKLRGSPQLSPRDNTRDDACEQHGHHGGHADGQPGDRDRGLTCGRDPQPNPAQPNPDNLNNTPPTPSEGGRQRWPKNLTQALEFAPMQRAQALLDHPESWQWVEPHKWPEVQSLGAAFAASCGWHAPKWTQSQSSAVKRLVGLLAEFTGDELSRATVAAKASEFLRGKGLSSLSDEVVRRLLSSPGAQAPAQEAPWTN
jgi:hypothetical protein